MQIRRMPNIFWRVFGSQEAVLIVCLIALFRRCRFDQSSLRIAERNLSSIFLGNAYIAVAAIGMSMVIISGNIDISVGSLIGVLATISGSLAVNGYPIIVSWTRAARHRWCSRNEGYHGSFSSLTCGFLQLSFRSAYAKHLERGDSSA